MKALLVHDEELFRIGLKHILESIHDFDRVIELNDGADLPSLSIADVQEIAIAIIKPECFQEPAITYWRTIRDICPNIVIVAFTDSPELLVQYPEAIAVSPRTDTVELLTIIRGILNRMHSTNALPTQNIRLETQQPLTVEPENRLSEFSKRRLQVLELIAEGLSNREIATRLEVTESTVKAHVHILMKMLNVTNRTQISLWYHRQIESPYISG